MMPSAHASVRLRAHGWAACVVLFALALVGCRGRDADLDSFIQETKASPGGRVEPLPEVKPYQAFSYSAQGMRSPFVPGGSGVATGVRPDVHRPREFLEQYALDTLKMVGTLNLSGRYYGLVLARDGRVHRVSTGEHMGQNDGTITEVTPTKIALTEIIPDGLGGYVERPAALGLTQ
jgi:type IV pilus assembly protein PilP